MMDLPTVGNRVIIVAFVAELRDVLIYLNSTFQFLLQDIGFVHEQDLRAASEMNSMTRFEYTYDLYFGQEFVGTHRFPEHERIFQTINSWVFSKSLIEG